VSCPEIKDDLLLLALDALESPERERVQAHLAAGCPGCLGALAEAQAMVAMIPLALDPVEPPVSLKARLLERAERDERPSLMVVRRSWIPTLAAAAVAALLVTTVATFPLRHLQDKNTALTTDLRQLIEKQDAFKSEIAQKTQQIEQLSGQLAQAQESLKHNVNFTEFLNTPGLLWVELKGTPQQPGAAGYVIVDKPHHRFVLTGNLKFPGAGKTYELWFIAGDNKIPAGTFDVDEKGRAALSAELPADANITLAAITDEPAGGSKSPTGAIHLLGKLQ